MLDLDAIAATLNRHPEASEWTARLEQSESWQLYLVGHERENLRSVTTTRAALEVHRDREGKRGSSSLVLAEGDQQRLDSLIDEAVFMASLNANPLFRLPDPRPYPTLETVDGEIEAKPQSVALQLQERVLDTLVAESNVRTSSLEVFLSRARVRLRTSAGVDASRAGTSLHLELVLLARDGDHEGESYGSYRRRRVADLEVEREVARQARQARDQIRAGVPATHKGPVVIGGEAVANFFDPIVFHTGGSARYRKMSRLEVNQPLTLSLSKGEQGPSRGNSAFAGERLTLAGDPLLPFGSNTAPFDDDGVPAQRVALVKDGVVAALWATKRYADYLDIPVTGQLGNLVAAPGATSTFDLLAQASPTLLVEAFSWFDPDPISGDFVAEVRLGYDVDKNGRTPVKGGSVSGNVFTALANARFSRETAFLGAYHGPEAIWLGDLTISGE